MNRWPYWIFCIGALLASSFVANVSKAQSVGLGEYWSGSARWEYVRKWTPSNSGIEDAGASHIEVRGSTWYLFSRFWVGPKCAGRDFPQLGTQVFRSDDKGATWSQPATAIVPSTAADSCAATDGDAFYDEASNTWHLLYQCLGADNVWRGCHATRVGTDPMGAFTPNLSNPVVNARQLWKGICNSVNDDCVLLSGGANRVYDEGTFNIFEKRDGYYWVSFHGYDGVRGYRGIAKSHDFVNWIVGDTAQGLPADSIVDALDMSVWREGWNAGGPIGAGAGSIVKDRGYYYLLTEGPDKNLACTAGQNWDLGIFRSSSLTSTSWDQYPKGNPIVYSSRQVEGPSIPACNVQYPQLFVDAAGDTYLKYYRSSDHPDGRGTYLYKLVESHNVLVNGDLWMGTEAGWSKLPAGAGNLVTYRWPNSSSDSGPFLATNCGSGNCAPGQSFYQDVDVLAHRGKRFDFGGKFSVHLGNSAISLTVWQLDANYGVVRSHSLYAPAQAYFYQASASAMFTIEQNTRYLRYQAYLGEPGITYYADEMYLNIYPQ